MAMLGEKTGAYTAVHSEDDSMFEADKLKEFDAVIMLNTDAHNPNMDTKMTKKDFVDMVRLFLFSYRQFD